MSDQIEKWPPAPNKALAAKTEIEKQNQQGEEIANCPSCGRKLLTVRSVLCNWCGARIENEEYLARAAKERAAQDAAERERIELEISETARYGSFGRLKRMAKSGKKPLDEPPLSSI
jgi:hypothetical protein